MKKIQSVAFLISISLLMFSYTAEAQKLREAEVGVPDSVTYGFFFQHLSDLDDFALRQIAIGQDGEGWRTHVQHEAGLTDDEGAILKEVAYDSIRAVKKVDAKLQPLLGSRPAMVNRQSISSITPPSEASLLLEERWRVIVEHLATLRARLGEDAFQKLDRYVDQKIRTSIQTTRLGTNVIKPIGDPGGDPPPKPPTFTGAAPTAGPGGTL